MQDHERDLALLGIEWEDGTGFVARQPPRRCSHERPWLGVDCLGCERIRRDADKYGFNEHGFIAYPKRKAVFPWEAAA